MAKQLNDVELRMLLDLVTTVARTARFIDIDDLEGWQEIISKSHAIGPFLDPTKYRDEGMNNLEEQQTLLTGFMAFRRAIDKIEQMGMKRKRRG